MNDPITDALRRHDPAAGKSLTAFERTRILERARATAPRLRLAWAFALLTVAVVAVLAAVRSRHPAAVPADRPEVRQIQCTTPGGTRIVWTLDPDFRM